MDVLRALGDNTIAIYGAVLATAVFIRQIVDARAAMSRSLRVEVDVAQMHVPVNMAGEYEYAGDIVDFVARNVGMLDVRVIQCGLARTEWRRGRRVIVERLAMPLPAGGVRFPHDIPAGQSASFYATAVAWCANPPEKGWRAYKYVYFEDALRRFHKARVSRKFFHDLERLCAAQVPASGSDDAQV